jgi:two-component system, NarL family, sensor kinase
MSVPGQVESEFLAAIGRFTGPVRGVGLLLISGFGVLSVPDNALLLGFALLALMVTGTVADFRAPRLALVLALARAAAVCAAQVAFGGGSSTWALNVLTTTAITLQWEWPPKVTVPATAALLAVHLAAVGMHDASTDVLRVVVECVLARLAFELLRRSTRRVDDLRARRAALEREEAVALERRRREREYLALLHDTAAATFLMVAVHGRDANPTEVAGYAHRDLAVLTGTSGAPRDSEVDVGSSLRAVVERSPLTVHAQWETVLVPASVALALVRAVREATVNVERHAGTDTVELSLRAKGRGVVVTVTDTGRGFDPQNVPSHRRGIRGSIVERMAAVGGNATLTSRRGTGTVVQLVWPHG